MDVRTLGKEGFSNNGEKSGHGEGRGLAGSGHPFQCGFLKREEGI